MLLVRHPRIGRTVMEPNQLNVFLAFAFSLSIRLVFYDVPSRIAKIRAKLFLGSYKARLNSQELEPDERLRITVCIRDLAGIQLSRRSTDGLYALCASGFSLITLAFVFVRVFMLSDGLSLRTFDLAFLGLLAAWTIGSFVYALGLILFGRFPLVSLGSIEDKIGLNNVTANGALAGLFFMIGHYLQLKGMP